MGTPFLEVLANVFQNYWNPVKVFNILIEFRNILHWKPAKKIKSGVVLWQNLGQIMSNIVKKVKKQATSLVFLYFTWGLTFEARSSG